MDENKLTIIYDGEEVMCDILFTHYSEETMKNYVVFQFSDRDEISAAVFVETENGEGYFEDVQTDEEWEMLDELLENFIGDSQESDDADDDEDAEEA
ncbi:uncharacterized protein YrzB (UPF0473 family) [Acholeplasma morum]|jgi:uncharacterized protein YrzB (UPF0473 family)|uniref:DUF1292 domain-containing protein n=1 Tax=Paracholeplasma morum TaxID=264637 RepID=UPI0019572790|nr:DUF1292 domain-containing protein [Paracholeplasma morum]MBM7453661.1 uncharacterized protein YrzB (UPF0473 family) [Paracholeplasma morum]